MYLYETGLGEIFKPRPKAQAKPTIKAPAKPPQAGWVKKDGHRRFCSDPDRGTVSCDLNLKIRFRRSFDEFLRTVEDAYGRWMAKPTAQRLTKTLRGRLKELHQELLGQTVFDNDPIVLVAGLHYRQSNGAWLVERSDVRQYQRLIDV